MNAIAFVFEAVPNFRDCGGYPTRDGRVVRRGLLFRSGQFPLASDGDVAALGAINFHTIVDLRRPLERETNPNRRWEDFAACVIEHPGFGDEVYLPPHLAAFETAGESAESARAAMLQIYREMPFDPMILELYRDYFTVLAEAEGPVLVHCAAGKDRTGVAVALTHHILGVNEEHMLANYLANSRTELEKSIATDRMREFFGREGRPVSDEAIRTILEVNRDYLEEAFKAMHARHGSLDGYLSDAVGVTAAQRAAIRERFLTDAG